jgi:hypothetical protein
MKKNGKKKMKKKWKNKVDKVKLIEGRFGDQRVPMNANVDFSRHLLRKMQRSTI